jgi:acyl-homoserine lactone acylase PvdQ
MSRLTVFSWERAPPGDPMSLSRTLKMRAQRGDDAEVDISRFGSRAGRAGFKDPGPDPRGKLYTHRLVAFAQVSRTVGVYTCSKSENPVFPLDDDPIAFWIDLRSSRGQPIY